MTASSNGTSAVPVLPTFVPFSRSPREVLDGIELCANLSPLVGIMRHHTTDVTEVVARFLNRAEAVATFRLCRALYAASVDLASHGVAFVHPDKRLIRVEGSTEDADAQMASVLANTQRMCARRLFIEDSFRLPTPLLARLHQMHQLRELTISDWFSDALLAAAPPMRLHLPTSLIRLRLCWHNRASSARSTTGASFRAMHAYATAMVRSLTAGSLPNLRAIDLEWQHISMSEHNSSLDLSPLLAAAGTLEELRLVDILSPPSTFLPILARLPHLTNLIVEHRPLLVLRRIEWTYARLTELLTAPHSPGGMQRLDFSRTLLDTSIQAMVTQRLTHLTDLEFELIPSAIELVDCLFLRSLPRLKRLALNFQATAFLSVECVQSIVSCPLLTDLSIRCALVLPEALTLILGGLAHLSRLEISRCELGSFSSFSAIALLATTLRTLHIGLTHSIPRIEARHFYSLVALESMHLDATLTDPLPAPSEDETNVVAILRDHPSEMGARASPDGSHFSLTLGEPDAASSPLQAEHVVPAASPLRRFFPRLTHASFGASQKVDQ